MKKNSVKNIRINGELQKVLAEIIRAEIKDPRIHPFTSVIAVEVAPDLKQAKAWISVLGDAQVKADTMAGLKSANGFIRKRLADEMNLRNTPEIKFIMDESIEYAVNMSKKIADVTKDMESDPTDVELADEEPADD